MTCHNKETVRSKIRIDNTSLEQINLFKYLGRYISFEFNRDIEKEILTFNRVCGTIRRPLCNNFRKDNKLKFYKTMAVLPLYGCETWVINRKICRRKDGS